jgi:Fic family protein
MTSIASLIAAYQAIAWGQVPDYHRSRQIAMTQQSTWLEGCSLSGEEVGRLLREGIIPKEKPLLHSQMVKDHDQALRFVLAAAKERRELSPALVQEINSAVLKNTGPTYRTLFGEIDSSKGLYRKSNIGSPCRGFVHFEKVKALVKQACANLGHQLQKASSTEERLNLSFDAVYELACIHPFYDGNGRTARLLMNYIQAYCGLPLSLVFAADKAAYTEALEASRAKGDSSDFRTFMMSQYRQLLTQEMEAYRQGAAPLPA